MTIIAFLMAALTVVLGVVVLAFWSGPERNADRRSLWLASAHVLVAVTGVGTWVWHLIGRNSLVGWAAVIALLTAVTLGGSTLVSSRRRERPGPSDVAPDPVPLALLIAHGVAAAGAVALAVLAVAQQ